MSTLFFPSRKKLPAGPTMEPSSFAFIRTYHHSGGLIRGLFRSLVPLLAGIAACRTPTPAPISQTREQMGTVVSITVIDPDSAVAKQALNAAFTEIDRIDALLSTYKEKSEISRLNRDAALRPGPDLRRVASRALEFNQLTGGAFDPTIKPLLDLYRESFAATGHPPDSAEFAAARSRVGAQHLHITSDQITLDPGTEITLDGLAKGYAIDRSIETLRARGIRCALVNAGGDLRALGDKAGSPWRVALQNPRDPADYLTAIDLRDAAVATSGDYRRYFDAAMTHHHILDPRTGSSATDLISVTVRAPTAMAADALATALFVMGPEAGVALVETLPEIEALLITPDRRILHSSGW